MAGSRKLRSTEAVSVADVVRRMLSARVRANEWVDVAYSGGLDSTVLLHCARKAAAEDGYRVRGVHINHGLSPNAFAWAEHCRSLCAAWNIDLHVATVHVSHNTRLGLEGAARLARYEVLEQSDANWILLAHHADDQAETVLQNLLRGSGVRGLAGMTPVRGRFLRPLLSVSHSALTDYATQQCLSWVEDESNADTRLTRNHIRQDLLPKMLKRFPAARQQLAATAERLAEADELLAQLAKLDAGRPELAFPLPLSQLRDLESARAANLLRYTLFTYNLQAPSHRRTREFIRQVQTAGTDKHPELHLGRWLLRCHSRQLHLIEHLPCPEGE